jgi:NhaP-type Na+/H+ or K+/H+ antiporter
VLLLLVRPLTVLASFVRSPVPMRQRLFLGWFGVRGIGSLYYAAAAVGVGTLGVENEVTVFWTIAACVIVSILAHGVTASPVAARLAEEATPSRAR